MRDGTRLVLANVFPSRFKEFLPGRFRRTQHGLGLALSLIWLSGAVAAQELRETKPIHTAGAAHGLSVADAAEGRPIMLTANVAYYTSDDGPWGAMLFVIDPTGGVFVRLAKQPVVPLREGELVEVSGVSAPGEFTAVVSAATVRVVDGKSVPERASRMDVADLVTGRFDCWQVEVHGQVHAVLVGQKSVGLRVSTDQGLIVALLEREPSVDYQKFADAAVVVRGVVAPDFNQHRQMTGIHMFVQSAHDISTLTRGGSDPFASGVRPIGHIGEFDPSASELERLHFQGQTTLDWPGRMVCLQDATGGLCVANASMEKIAVGSTVDVAGYPVFAVAIPTVEDALVRGSSLPLRTIVLPQPLVIKKVLNGEYSGELVAVDGQLVGVGSDAQNWQLTLTSDGVFYTATLPKDGDLTEPSPWPAGSTVRVVGVCQQEVDPFGESGRVWVSSQRFKSFRVLMRTKDDIKVLRTPSWWTPGRAVLILSMTLMLTTAGFFWVILLRRRVEQKTQELRRSEERYRNLAQHDPLTGAPNRALLRDRIEVALERAKRQSHQVGVLLLDLDRFKPINDELGHEAGDRVLCALVQRASAAVRKTDTVARIGGDEFAILLPDLGTAENAPMVAEKILRAVCQPLVIGTREVSISTSLGVAVYPDDGLSIEELMRKADVAMYEAKKKSRGSAGRYEHELVSRESSERSPEQLAGLSKR